jgi:hypothetical protein
MVLAQTGLAAEQAREIVQVAWPDAMAVAGLCSSPFRISTLRGTRLSDFPMLKRGANCEPGL